MNPRPGLAMVPARPSQEARMMEAAKVGTPPANAATRWPAAQPIGIADILEVLAAGLRDFRAAPLYRRAVAPAPGAT